MRDARDAIAHLSSEATRMRADGDFERAELMAKAIRLVAGKRKGRRPKADANGHTPHQHMLADCVEYVRRLRAEDPSCDAIQIAADKYRLSVSYVQDLMLKGRAPVFKILKQRKSDSN